MPLKGSGITLGPYQSWIQIRRVNETMSIHKVPTSARHIVITKDIDYTEDNELSLLIIFWILRALHV